MPSDADKARWAALAEKAKTPLSKLVIEIVESTLAENEEFQPRHEIIKKLEGLRNEIKTIRMILSRKILCWIDTNRNLSVSDRKHS